MRPMRPADTRPQDFASFLKRRGALEEEHAGSLKKLSRLTIDGLRKPESRHESYSTQFEQVLHANERIADNGTQFGLALHAMHENLLQLANKMDTNRKTWKQQGLAAENKVQDAERLAEKAKAKYDQLADDLDRVKTGDTGAGRKFGLKGPKSAAQHEEDLQRKTQAADQDYASKVQTAQALRKELVASTRPQAVAALTDLVKETDAALTMEMQKYGISPLSLSFSLLSRVSTNPRSLLQREARGQQRPGHHPAATQGQQCPGPAQHQPAHLPDQQREGFRRLHPEERRKGAAGQVGSALCQASHTGPRAIPSHAATCRQRRPSCILADAKPTAARLLAATARRACTVRCTP